MPIVLLVRAMVDEAVDGLVRDDAAAVLAAKFSCNLLGRPARLEAFAHVRPQRGIARELEARIPAAPALPQRLGAHRLIAPRPGLGLPAVALQLPTDGAGRSSQGDGDRTHRTAFPVHAI